ncbi:MAG: ECF transporter S component [Oscillospiraceae bacterium]|jgi:uncharacterized membrane protein|nr:ECF transporter S component [Oscillospiraceae bacterium]
MAKQPTLENTPARSSGALLVQMVLTALMAALVFAATYLLHIPVPGTQGGYANMGDMVIFLAAVLLGNPWAAFAAALGSGLADFLYGATAYILPTVIIKGLMGFLCAALAKRDKPSLFRLGSFLGGIVMCGGYFLFEMLYFRVGEITGLAYALNALPMNIIQAAANIAAAWLLYKPVLALKKKLVKQQ